MPDHTEPDDATKAAEAADAEARATADRAPSPDEEAAAETRAVDPDVARAEKEYNRLGAEVEGEGRIE